MTFRTRPQQVEAMIVAAREAGVPFAWFTADEESGQNPGLRDVATGDVIGIGHSDARAWLSGYRADSG